MDLPMVYIGGPHDGPKANIVKICKISFGRD